MSSDPVNDWDPTGLMSMGECQQQRRSGVDIVCAPRFGQFDWARMVTFARMREPGSTGFVIGLTALAFAQEHARSESLAAAALATASRISAASFTRKGARRGVG